MRRGFWWCGRRATLLEDRLVRDLPDLLRAGDTLVVNDTKVIPARLRGRRIGREAEPKIEATLIRRLDGSRWRALVKPARKLAAGDVVRFGEEGRVCFLGQLDATVEAKGEAARSRWPLRFTAGCSTRPSPSAARSRCRPTSRRGGPDEQDNVDYQTMFASEEGAVAAPTAGLHFTDALMARLADRGIGLAKVTLHVGAGTFLPVTAEEVSQHKMHSEWGEVTKETAAQLNAARAKGGRIVAVGTTSLRLIESATGEDGTIAPFSGDTALFITPGYRFRAIDVLLTNFHLPRSTLFMLVSAFCGLDTMKRAYAYAIAAGYRFYSYGDACLLYRQRT